MNGVQKKLAANMYPITGLSDTAFKLRILKINEDIPDDNNTSFRLQKWADILWRRKLRCPVFPSKRDNDRIFLVPDSAGPFNDSIELEGVPGKTYHIIPTDETYDITIEDAKGVERELICRILERPFTDKLRSMNDIFWKSEWTFFCYSNPANSSVREDGVNAYRGFKFGVVLRGNNPFFVADVRTRYLGRKSFVQYSPEEKKIELLNHTDSSIPIKRRLQFIRDNGSEKIPCRYSSETNQTISEYVVNDLGKSVYDYYKEKHPDVKLNSSDMAVFVQDHNKDEPYAVPASRLFPIFEIGHPLVKNCSIKSQITPQERMDTISPFLRYFDRVSFGTQTLTVERAPLTDDRVLFIPPKLEFGDGKMLSVILHEGQPIIDDAFEASISKFGSRKMGFIYESTPYLNDPLPQIVLIYPNTISRRGREEFIQKIQKEIKLQTSQDVQIVKQIEYKTGNDQRRGRSLLSAAIDVKKSNPGALALVILWDNFFEEVHTELKDIIDPMKSQCVWEETFNSICLQNHGNRSISQLRNLALGVTTEGGIKPWVLADDLNYNLYLGIDALYGRVCYNFLWGKGGRYFKSVFKQNLSNGKMREAIKAPDFHNVLFEELQSIVNDGASFESIVIHRDGRWWPSESRGLNSAIKDLKKSGHVSEKLAFSVLEIHKGHTPIRLMSKNPISFSFTNPLPGTYLKIDDNQVIINTTGKPGQWDSPYGRTAKTLLLKVAEQQGDFDIIKLAEDSYRLTHLNWSAPEIEINIPVTVRFADELLRETTRTIDASEVDEDADEVY